MSILRPSLLSGATSFFTPPKNKSTLNAALLLASIATGFLGLSEAAAVTINVSLSSSTSTSTTEFIRGSAGVNSPITIPHAPAVAYDAADQSDPGTTWNSIICPNNPSDPTQTLREVGLPLVDSNGNSGPYNFSAYVQDENFELSDDNPQPFTVSAPGTDGLPANPSQLMAQGWQAPSATEELYLVVQGLTAG